MLLLGPLLLLAIAVVIAQSIAHHRTAGSGPSVAGPATSRRVAPVAGGDPSPARPLDEELAEWEAAGLITHAQSEAIARHERADLPVPAIVAPAAPRRVPPVAEALGYLGGVLAVVGLVLLVASRWEDMALGVRIGLATGAAVALVAGGFAVDERADPALARLRWSLWLAGTAAAGLAAAVLASDLLDWGPTAVVATTALTATALSASLWAGEERPVQQLVALAGGVVVVGSTVATIAGQGPAGLSVWLAGAGLVAVGLTHRTTFPALTIAVGALALPVGGALVAGEWEVAGIVTLLVGGIGLLALATLAGPADRMDRVVLAVVGGVAAGQGVPAVLTYFARDAGVATGLLTWAAGIGLLGLATRPAVRTPRLVQAVGAATVLGGAAVTAAQSTALATLLGLASAVGLVLLGTRPGYVLLSVLGAAGLLVFVPWAIGWFFPGEGRAPLLILVTGALIVAVAVLLARMGRRLRDEIGGRQSAGRT